MFGCMCVCLTYTRIHTYSLKSVEIVDKNKLIDDFIHKHFTVFLSVTQYLFFICKKHVLKGVDMNISVYTPMIFCNKSA